MKKRSIIIVLVAMLFGYGESVACTSAIVAAAKSSEGVPLLWKHRDSNKWNCHIAYVQGEKYAYTALVSLDGYNTYCGINEKGFAVMNNATYNVPRPEKKKGKGSSAVVVMADILGNFATVEEFEAWLASPEGKQKHPTIYAVGDAKGVVAYFEAGQDYYKRYDEEVLDKGYDARGNFSFSGWDDKRGASVERYNIAMNQLRTKAKFAPHDFVEFSRNYQNISGGCVLDEPNRVVRDHTSINRITSAATTVMVCDVENPRMLVAVGHPAATMAVPVYVKAKHAIPQCVSGKAMLELGNEFRTKAYKNIAKGKDELDKDIIRKAVKINTKCEMPSQMPSNIDKFNAKIDKQFAKHAKKVRKVLK
jgi:hypothetical protein